MTIATVDPLTGKVTAIALGEATITARVSATDYYNAGTISYKVLVAQITLSRTSFTMPQWHGYNIRANVAPEAADQNVTWTSSDENVAILNNAKTQSGETNWINAQNPGTATITAKAGKLSVSITVTVKKEGYVSFDNYQIFKTPDAAQFINNFNHQGDATLTFSSSNPQVATVNATTGEVTIVGKGWTQIKATPSTLETDEYCYGGSYYSYELTVREAIVFDAGTIAASSSELCANLIDGNVNTKYRAYTWNKSGGVWYCEFHIDTENPVWINGYQLVSGDNVWNNPGLNPKNWKLKAKANQADEWTVVSEVNNYSWNGWSQEYQWFYLDTYIQCKYFRFEVSENTDGNEFELSEIMFWWY